MEKQVFLVNVFLILLLSLSACSGGADAIPLTDTPAPTPIPTELPSEIVDAKGVEMVLVTAGEFSMGNDEGYDNEKPVHQVYLDGYYIDKYEVTNKLYKMCVEKNVCNPPVNPRNYNDLQYEQYPVIHVKWDMANTYCEWRGARLPAEAEWEKAAKGTDDRAYPWGNEFDGSIANFCDGACILSKANKDWNDGYEEISPVGSYPKGVSPYGVFDMAGNVWEWTADWYEAYPGNTVNDRYYGNTIRIARGGSWHDDYRLLGTTIRGGYPPSLPVNDTGFRCAKSP